MMESFLVTILNLFFTFCLLVNGQSNASCNKNLTGNQNVIDYSLPSTQSTKRFSRHNYTWCITPPSNQQDVLLVLKFIDIKYLVEGDQIVMPDGTGLNYWYAYINLPTYQIYALFRHQNSPNKLKEVLKNEIPHIRILKKGEPAKVGISIKPTFNQENEIYYYSLKFEYQYWFVPIEENLHNNMSFSFYLKSLSGSLTKQENVSTNYITIIVLVLLLLVCILVIVYLVIKMRKATKLNSLSQSSIRRSLPKNRPDVIVVQRADEYAEVNTIETTNLNTEVTSQTVNDATLPYSNDGWTEDDSAEAAYSVVNKKKVVNNVLYDSFDE